ncbi:beta-1,3-galactosyltransferase 2-like, partial [Pelobates cultripes]
IRNAIRETWGNENNYNDVPVVRVFLVATSPHRPEAVQRMLEEESEYYGDIIQQDFLDTYYNLTLKTLMGMEWVAKFCSSASYMIKIDSDMFLNVEYLIHQVLRPELPVQTNYFTGQIYSNKRPIRSKANKWYMPPEIYPNKTYPPFCVGSGYVFSADLAKKIYEIAQVVPAIPLEDVFMGICLYVLNIAPTYTPGNVFNRYGINYNLASMAECLLVYKYECLGNDTRVCGRLGGLQVDYTLYGTIGGSHLLRKHIHCHYNMVRHWILIAQYNSWLILTVQEK